MNIYETVKKRMHVCKELIETLAKKYHSEDVLSDIKRERIPDHGEIEMTDGVAKYRFRSMLTMRVSLILNGIHYGCFFNREEDRMEFSRVTLSMDLEASGIKNDLGELRDELRKLIDLGYVIGDPTDAKNRLYLADPKILL